MDARTREAGFRMDPLEVADLIGQDINLSFSESKRRSKGLRVL